MKKYVMIILCLSMAIVVFGCNSNDTFLNESQVSNGESLSSTEDETSGGEIDVSNDDESSNVQSTVSGEVSKEDIGSKNDEVLSDMEIYQISRETFDEFLKNPNAEMFNSNNSRRFVYSGGGHFHSRISPMWFEITQPLFDFVSNKTNIREFLSKNDINSIVCSAVIIDAPRIPMVIWVETEREDFYINIDRDVENEYRYELYTSTEYIEKYGLKYGSLEINGKNIENKYSSKLYFNHADVPFLTVMESLGATIETNQNGRVEFSIKDNNYVLDFVDITLYDVDEGSIDLFEMDGGFVFVYQNNDEIMVDSMTLNNVLWTMKIPVNIDCDRAKSKVSINCKTVS